MLNLNISQPLPQPLPLPQLLLKALQNLQRLQKTSTQNFAILALEQTSQSLEACKQKLKQLHQIQKAEQTQQTQQTTLNSENNIKLIHLPMMSIELYTQAKKIQHSIQSIKTSPISTQNIMQHHIFISPNSIVASHLLNVYQPNLNAQQHIYSMGEFSAFCFKQCFKSFFEDSFAGQPIIVHQQQAQSPTAALIDDFKQVLANIKAEQNIVHEFNIYTGTYASPTQANVLIDFLKSYQQTQKNQQNRMLNQISIHEYQLFSVNFNWQDAYTQQLLQLDAAKHTIIAPLASSAQANFFIQAFLTIKSQLKQPIYCFSQQAKVVDICKSAGLLTAH